MIKSKLKDERIQVAQDLIVKGKEQRYGRAIAARETGLKRTSVPSAPPPSAVREASSGLIRGGRLLSLAAFPPYKTTHMQLSEQNRVTFRNGAQ